MTTPRIARFIGQYRFLSSFWSVRITVEGVEYPSVEHAYQASKTLSLSDRLAIRKLFTPGMAKRYGRNVLLRPGWNTMKVDVMFGLIQQKFSNPTLRTMLLDTGEAELVEVNNWGDTFWGVFQSYGENNLGKLLMKVRAEIREAADA